MLVAKRKDGRLFSLLNRHGKAALLALRKRENFYCPACGENVQMRLGHKRSWHFAHHRRTSCPYKDEPESSYHLQGKKQLYNWLIHQHADVKLEPYLSHLQQRPDLLLHTRPANTALEFQCATIDPALLNHRTQTFKNAGIVPIWLLGGNRLKRIGTSTFQIEQMDWQALQTHSIRDGAVFLLYFCPESSQFATLTSLTPYSATKAFARLQYYAMSSFSVQQLYHASTDHHVFTSEQWASVKKRWRLHAYRYQSRTHLFMKGLFPTLSLFPPAAGLPTSYLHTIETPCFLWQSWLFHQFYLQWPTEKPIMLQNVVTAFNTLVKQRIFHVRSLPLVSTDKPSAALLAYLRSLTKLGFMRESQTGLFYKRNEQKMPQSMAEAHHFDAVYFAKLFDIS